jgi:hypothetical protein
LTHGKKILEGSATKKINPKPKYFSFLFQGSRPLLLEEKKNLNLKGEGLMPKEPKTAPSPGHKKEPNQPLHFDGLLLGAAERKLSATAR